MAQRLGTTQPLLYRYFSRKEILIEAVLSTVLERQTAINWNEMLQDESRSLRKRLINVFTAYATQIYDRQWIRLYMFAGLAGGELNRRYITSVTEPMLRAVVDAIRVEFRCGGRRTRQMKRLELECAWLFHGGLYYHAIRKYVYDMQLEEPTIDVLIETGIDQLIDTIKTLPGAA